jgi:hypothetical protein
LNGKEMNPTSPPKLPKIINQKWSPREPIMTVSHRLTSFSETVPKKKNFLKIFSNNTKNTKV